MWQQRPLHAALCPCPCPCRAVSVRYLFPQHDVADDDDNNDDDDEAPRLLLLLLIMIIEVAALIFAHMQAISLCPPVSPYIYIYDTCV